MSKNNNLSPAKASHISPEYALTRLKRDRFYKSVVELGELFKENGYELALVGGSVRDLLLGKLIKDYDFTTSARPDETLRILKQIAKKTWSVGKAFGTISGLVHGQKVEITTYRKDEYDGKTRKPTVTFGDTIKGDLIRRDFTINAMAVSTPDIEFIDYFSGLEHLEKGLLITPIEPEISFKDDPLRMLRAIRFLGRFDNFSIEENTFNAIVKLKDSINIVSKERVQDELKQIILSRYVRYALEAFVDCGLCDLILPELTALKLETDKNHRHKDIYLHTLKVLEQAIDLEPHYITSEYLQKIPNARLILRLAAVLHDIGKPKTRRFAPNGKVTFYAHDVVGAKTAKKRMRELKFDNDVILKVCRLIELHMRFYGYGQSGWTDSAVRRYVADAGDLLPLLHVLTRADVTTQNRRKAEALEFAYDDLEDRIEQLKKQEELDSIRPGLNGHEIMEILNLKEGKEVGLAYKYMLDVRFEKGELSKEEAKKILLDWYNSRKSE